MTLYKVLGPNAESIHSGKAQWHKPVGKRHGKWMPVIGDPRCCKRGYHLVELYALSWWLKPDCTIWEAEGRGPSHSDGEGKTAFAQARLLRRVYLSEQGLRLFAADCAEHVLHIWTARYPEDDRPQKAIEAARAFARDEITLTALAQATAAAWEAAGVVVRDAAGAAAGAAAWVAAREAAEDAAETAARAAEDAAGAAAWAAVRDAVRDAAEGWEEDAAWEAARAAERQWQRERLATYLRSEP